MLRSTFGSRRIRSASPRAEGNSQRFGTVGYFLAINCEDREFYLKYALYDVMRNDDAEDDYGLSSIPALQY